MKAITFKGFVKEVSGKQAYKPEGRQSVTMAFADITEPGYTDQFGDKKGQDSVYRVKAFNEKIELLGVLSVGDKVEVTCYLNSKEFKKESGEIDYPMYLNLTGINKL